MKTKYCILSCVCVLLLSSCSNQEELKEWKLAHGVIPSISSDAKTITYGMYPQSNVNDTSLISTLNTLSNPNKYGYYNYNNEYYYKYNYAVPYQSGYSFDNGISVVRGATYWFKVEPIKWKVLENNNGIYFVTTESILLSSTYNWNHSGTKSRTDYQGNNTDAAFANNYKYSIVRSWLNTDFYDQVFFLDNDNIEVSTIDNSATSTLFSSNPYVCEDTNDKLFLLSAKELTTIAYGFKNDYSLVDSVRQCKTTDYARADCVFVDSSINYLNNSWYYTRSPLNYYPNKTRVINFDGSFYDRSEVDMSHFGLRPAMRLTLDE